MRPVLLELDGFASFRDPTTVDFAGAEYFALVGPTGSGKSTVIDAMTFALYGTVPRWQDKRMVMYALAPTALRGTVRLVFDLDPERFVVARELKRTKQGVQIKNARLERLYDPTTTGTINDLTEVIASDGAVTGAVEKLLGLSFEHFCQCVVLPQGEFAQFLRAKGSERREILLKLLGAGLYRDIAREANARAALAGQRAVLLADQLGDLADATEDAETIAAERESALLDLTDGLAVTLPRLRADAAELDEAQRTCDRLTSEHLLLTALRMPDGVGELAVAITTAQAALLVARTTETSAEMSDTAARARLAGAPDRGPLEQARREHAEHNRIQTERPAARAEVESAAAQLSLATRASDAAAGSVETTRRARDTAASRAAAALAEVEHLTAEFETLGAVALPKGLSELDERTRTARRALQAAAGQLAATEQRDTTARAALQAAPRRAPLETALGLLVELAEATAAILPLEHLHQRAAGEYERTQAALVATTVARDSARVAQEEVAVANRAASLRPHLAVGDACPVCEQPVATLPPPMHVPELAAADKAVTAAEGDVTRARAADSAAAGAAATAAAHLLAATERVTRLHSRLDGQPTDEAVLRDSLARLDELEVEARTAGDALREARTTHSAATAAGERVDAAATAARTALRTARDPLVALGAPVLDDRDLLDAWTRMVAWAQEQANARRVGLAVAKTDNDAAQSTLLAAENAFSEAEIDAAARRKTETQTTAAHERAITLLTGLESRLGELKTALDGAPSDADATAQLRQIDAFTAAVRVADAALRGARSIREQAEASAEALTRDAAAAWQVLRTTRDGLVPLGAPDLPDGSALAGWNTLLTWSTAQADARSLALPAARDAVVAATRHRDETAGNLVDEFAALDVTLSPGDLSETAPVAATAAVTQARADRERIAERRARAARLTTDRSKAETEHQVAKMLGTLLRSDQFPEWLEAAALDTLVADASVRLSELSNGQFELAHSGGEFVVIDHADADSQRSVRTLSGGETFQASLALALALSSQLSSMAAAGAARLDSIFLDEGFGTLDEATLEVVAATLENLADGNRMVGVVTHVAALAERVPVRFVVHRDQRTSSIVREIA